MRGEQPSEPRLRSKGGGLEARGGFRCRDPLQSDEAEGRVERGGRVVTVCSAIRREQPLAKKTAYTQASC